MPIPRAAAPSRRRMKYIIMDTPERSNQEPVNKLLKEIIKKCERVAKLHQRLRIAPGAAPRCEYANMRLLVCLLRHGVLFLAFAQTFMRQRWEPEWERTVKAAEQEGELSYYTVGDFNFISEFEKKFPRIKVKVVQGRGNELLVRIMTERRGRKILSPTWRASATPRRIRCYQAKTLQPIAAGVHFARSQRRVEMVVRQASIRRHARANIFSCRWAASR